MIPIYGEEKKRWMKDVKQGYRNLLVVCDSLYFLESYFLDFYFLASFHRQFPFCKAMS